MNLCRYVAQSVQIACTKCAKPLHKLCKPIAKTVLDFGFNSNIRETAGKHDIPNNLLKF